MLITIERVLILRSVSIFSTLPDESLARLAPALKEIRIPPGRVVLEKGSLGASLYLIVNGEVEVIDDGRVMAVLKERQVFGELAALDEEPRTATIRASRECLLLQLDQKDLYELVAEYPEVARGIIQFLCRRLRVLQSTLVED